MAEKFLDGQANVFGNLTQQDRRHILSRMERYGRAFAMNITKLLVRSSLTYLDKSKRDQDGDHFTRLKNGNISHALSNGNLLNTDKLGLKDRFAILQEHGDDLL